MARNKRHLIGIVLLIATVAYGLYRTKFGSDQAGSDVTPGRTAQAAD